ncbi:hypothetical protein LX69_02778 [Breznakibacter xylanolyticus]|uniref:Methylamine utilisation protein MauE domain-containing protein n=1 Tax=Breznakibacter xylanolyticus TaxID=990 RepID=A0A2W7N7Y1_9BACT|nr:BT_3928 family protein [Breznakibacter xylanolyticus]MBN2744405.1 DoxX family protein [Marinilabiliaceae bacterium]PZX12974.1 hypothetical protein LX69_02778 [Breznakibacter xylanolyticus]
MKAIRIISLWIIGLTFIFSGFVKAVDPIGGSIQLTDYLYAFHLEFFKGMVKFLAIGLAAMEFLIGIHLILQMRIKWVSWLMMVLMAFFTLLTLVIAIFNPVSDCGCFGEAVKLTNWQTFFKNLILFPFAVVIFVGRDKISSVLSPVRSTLVGLLNLCFILTISWYAYYDTPILDFRPFKVGVNIPHAMSIPADAEQPVYDTRFLLEKDGVQQEFGVNDYPYTDSTWVYVSSKTTLLKEGFVPAIKDLHISTPAQEEVTDLLLKSPSAVFVMLAPKLTKIDTTNMENVVKLHFLAQEKGFGFYIITASANDEISKFDARYGVGFQYLTADESTIRTITRANPGVMMLQNGTIIGKWNVNRIQDASIFSNPLEGALTMLRKRSDAIMLFSCFFLLLAGISIIFRYK